MRAGELPAEVRQLLDRGPLQPLIGGEFTDTDQGATFPTVDPANGRPLTTVQECTAADVATAVDAAKAALTGVWAATPPPRRAELLWRLADLIDEHRHELAVLESLDTGKPLSVAERYEVPMAAQTLRYFAGWATKVDGQAITPAFPYPQPQHIVSVRRPVGVVGAITPWNAPLMMQVWKLAPALACGNVVVHKPAEETPLTALRLAELSVAAGFPPGVLSVLPGTGEEAGAALVRHPGVHKIAFTGSTEIGRQIMRVAADRMARVTLELGGKSPYLVFADAAEQDLDVAAKAAALAVYTNSGQVCAAGSRLLVESSIHDEMVRRVAAFADKLTVGPGLNPASRMGPVISERQLERVRSYVQLAQAEGAVLTAGGQRLTDNGRAKGYYLAPTVFDDVRPGTQLWREEVFGPVVGITPFADVDAAVALANDTAFGLAAGVYTRDLSRAHRVASTLRAGTVWVNTYNLYDPAVPWGGFGQSGIGRENGAAAIEAFTESQTLWFGLG